MDDNEMKVLSRIVLAIACIAVISMVCIQINNHRSHLETLAVIEKGGKVRELEGKEFYVIPVQK